MIPQQKQNKDPVFNDLYGKELISCFDIGKRYTLAVITDIKYNKTTITYFIYQTWTSRRYSIIEIEGQYKSERWKNNIIKLKAVVNKDGYITITNQNPLKKDKILCSLLKKNGLCLKSGKKNTTILLARLLIAFTDNINGLQIHHDNARRNDNKSINLVLIAEEEHKETHRIKGDFHHFNGNNLTYESNEKETTTKNILLLTNNESKNISYSPGSGSLKVVKMKKLLDEVAGEPWMSKTELGQRVNNSAVVEVCGKSFFELTDDELRKLPNNVATEMYTRLREVIERDGASNVKPLSNFALLSREWEPSIKHSYSQLPNDVLEELLELDIISKTTGEVLSISRELKEDESVTSQYKVLIVKTLSSLLIAKTDYDKAKYLIEVERYISNYKKRLSKN